MSETMSPLIPFHRHVVALATLTLWGSGVLAADPSLDVLDPEWAATQAERERPPPPPLLTLDVSGLDLDRDGAIGTPSNPMATEEGQRKPVKPVAANPGWGVAGDGKEAPDGSRAASTAVKAEAKGAEARIGLDVAVPADDQIPVEPDPILRQSSSSGSAAAALEVKPGLGPLSGVKVEGKATPTPTGGTFQTELSQSWSMGGFTLTSRERYQVDQPMQGPEAAGSLPSSRLTHGLGITAPGGETGIDLSTTRADDPTLPGQGRWTNRIEGSQSIVGPLKLKVGTEQDETTGIRQSDVKAGFSIGF